MDNIRRIFNVAHSDFKKLRKSVFQTYTINEFKELLTTETVMAVEIGAIYFDVMFEIYDKDKNLKNKVGKKEILESYLKYLSDLRFDEELIFKSFWKILDRNPYDFEIDYFLKPEISKTNWVVENRKATIRFETDLKNLMKRLEYKASVCSA
ncbi:hypothetical protein BOP93_07105 [Pseudomonas orientalis]|uniref:Uncharacterized protein n=2 Tax=Pseudomonas orientalis TaxID=76758 RepID=A0A2L0RUH4_9PSED|nr:hypothetical protein BOP93_07105 [Pseudomonas orientalis]